MSAQRSIGILAGEDVNRIGPQTRPILLCTCKRNATTTKSTFHADAVPRLAVASSDGMLLMCVLQPGALLSMLSVTCVLVTRTSPRC